MIKKTKAITGSTAPIQNVPLVGGGVSFDNAPTRDSSMVMNDIIARMQATVMLICLFLLLNMNMVTSGSTVITKAISSDG